MAHAIGIRFVHYDESKHAINHFFGAPLLTEELKEEMNAHPDVFFLGSINLKDIAELDEENHLPHVGYLYFFFDASDSYRQLKPIVRYSEEEPTIWVDDFNESFSEVCAGVEEPIGIEFEAVEGNSDECKLLGVPCDWNYPSPPKEPLLLQIDHYDDGLAFLEFLDGYTYVFFGPRGKRFEGVTAHYEYA